MRVSILALTVLALASAACLLAAEPAPLLSIPAPLDLSAPSTNPAGSGQTGTWQTGTWQTGTVQAGTGQASSGPASPAPATQPTSEPAAAAKLTVEMLDHDAISLGHSRDTVVAKGGRILTLLRLANHLWPEDVQTNRQLVDIYEGMGELKSAAAAGAAYVRACPADYDFATRWLALALATMSKAEDQETLLKDVISRPAFGPEFHAFAGAVLADLYQRASLEAPARRACAEALKADPYCPQALDVQAAIERAATPAVNVARMLALLRGSPRDMRPAWAVAQQLQAAGLYEKALAFFAYTYSLAEQKRLSGPPAELLMSDYFNAMLDAGKAAQAVEFFAPLVDKHPDNLALRGLMVEAYRAAGQAEKATAQLDAMSKTYTFVADLENRRTVAQTAELAWFFTAFKPDAKLALKYANLASDKAPDDPFVRRALGAAELASGDGEAGVKHLTAIADKDPYAAALLAKYYFDKKDEKMGANVLIGNAPQVRTGPGWRALAAVVADKKVELPPVRYAEGLEEAAALPAYVMEMGVAPEKFVTVELSADKEVVVGAPITVTVTLKNISQQPVPVGRGGLFGAVCFLSLSIDGDVKSELPGLVVVPLPTPRWLPPGGTVTQQARIDVGPAETALMNVPFANLKLTVTAMLDAVLEGEKLIASLPGMKIAPVTINRPALIAADANSTAVNYQLAVIVRDLRQGDLAAQVRAARQTAALLCAVRSAETVKPAPTLPGGLAKPILLSMLKALLASDQPLVRAETLAALQFVNLDERIIALTSPCIDDKDALVRLRLIELLGAKRTAGHEKLLQIMVSDPDEFVKAMAAALSDRH